MSLSWATGPSSPGYRPEPDQGAPRNAAQYGDAVDVAPAMGLPVLLLSPTAAGPKGVPTDAGRQPWLPLSHTQLDPLPGTAPGTGTTGGTCTNATGGMCPRECCTTTRYGIPADGGAHGFDGTDHQKRARRPRGPRLPASKASATVPAMTGQLLQLIASHPSRGGPG